MEAFTRLEGIAAPLLRDNVDTDAIIPSRETRSVSREGYGEKLFADWRYLPGTREEDATFVLNKEPYRRARILLSGRNFGCGSSREAAVWALAQFGIRCVVASSFGAIFRGNCVRNGVLPAQVEPSALDRLVAAIEGAAEPPRLGVDLESCTISAGTARGPTRRQGSTVDSGRAKEDKAVELLVIPFEIASFDREMLLAGKEEIELTIEARPQIDAFEDGDRERRPWVHDASRGR